MSISWNSAKLCFKILPDSKKRAFSPHSSTIQIRNHSKSVQQSFQINGPRPILLSSKSPNSEASSLVLDFGTNFLATKKYTPLKIKMEHNNGGLVWFRSLFFLNGWCLGSMNAQCPGCMQTWAFIGQAHFWAHHPSCPWNWIPRKFLLNCRSHWIGTKKGTLT